MKAFQAAAGSCLDVNRVVPDMSVRRGKLTEVQSVTVIIPTYRGINRKSWESPLLANLVTTGAIRRYRNFAPFVRQTGERKTQTCVMAIFRQLTPSAPSRISSIGAHAVDKATASCRVLPALHLNTTELCQNRD